MEAASSREVRSSMRSTIFIVVCTPMSLVIRASSSSSSTSASMSFLPVTARVSFSRTPRLERARPSSRVCFFSELKIRLKKDMG